MKAIEATRGTVTIRGQEYIIAPPTPSDTARIAAKMREMARWECMNPIEAVQIIKDKLSPDVLATALDLAISKASGGGAEPNREAVLRAYDSLEGVRLQFWFLARKHRPGLTLDEVKNLIGEDDVYDLADAINTATSSADPAAPKS